MKQLLPIPLATLLSILLTACVFQKACAADKFPMFTEQLAAMDSMPVDEKKASELASDARSAFKIVGSPNTCQSVFILALAWDFQYLECQWLRSDDPDTRVAILSAVSILNNRDGDYIPEFARHAKRFAVRERKQREEEISWVEANRVRIAQLVVSRIKAKPGQSRIYDSYLRTAQAGKTSDK